MKILPVMMIKNEEYHIRAVVQPLLKVFGTVLIADTGSTDSTLDLIETMPGVETLQLGPQSGAGLTATRQRLTDIAFERGYDYTLLVDGDELYDETCLEHVQKSDLYPKDMYVGFLLNRSLERDERTGEYWIMDDKFSRMAIYSTQLRWKGDYPFESPVDSTKPTHYFGLPYPEVAWEQHGLHLHRLVRSSLDDQVAERKQKQFQYSMQDIEVPRWKAWYPKSEAELRLSGDWPSPVS